MKQETSVETLMAYAELKKLQPGEICPYSVLQAAIDKDPQEDGYSHVVSARRMVERELQCVLEAVPNEGIRRLVSREVINRGGRDLRHIRRSVHRGLIRQSTVVPIEQQGELSNEERLKFNVQFSQMGIIRHVLKPSNVKRIEARVADTTSMLPAKEAMRLFAERRTEERIKPANDGMVRPTGPQLAHVDQQDKEQKGQDQE